jgi:hypothetical protein
VENIRRGVTHCNSQCNLQFAVTLGSFHRKRKRRNSQLRNLWLLALAAPTIALGAAPATTPETATRPAPSTGSATGVPTGTATTDQGDVTSSSASVAATSDDSETEGIPRVTLLSCDETGASFEVRFPQAETYTEPAGDDLITRSYTAIQLSGTDLEDLPGSVGLPVFRAQLFIPPGAGATVSAQSFEPYSENVDNPLPAPRWVESGEGEMVSMVPVYELNPALASLARPTAELGEVETVRGWRLAHFLIRPVSYAGGRMTGYRRIRVEVSFVYPTGRPRPNPDTDDSIWGLDLARSLAPNFEYAREYGWRTEPPPPRGAELHSGQLPEPRLKVVVGEDGLYRITPEDLVAAGLDSDPETLDPRRLTLYTSSGKMLDFSDPSDEDPLYPIPVLVTGEDDGTFDEGDALYFWGHANITWRPEDEWDPLLPSYKNNYSPYGYYWLVQTDEPRRFTEVDSAPDDFPSLTYLQGRLHREEDKKNLARGNFMAKGMDLYFWDLVDSTNFNYFEYQLFDQNPRGGDGRLAFSFKGYKLDVDVTATLRVYTGDRPKDPSQALVTLLVDDVKEFREVWADIPAEELDDGTNYLTFEVSVPPSPDPDDPYYAGIYLDSLQVIYNRGLRLGTGALEGWGPDGVSGERRMHVTDVTGDDLIIWDLTRGESLVNFELSGTEGSREADFVWDAEPEYHLVATDLGGASSPLDVYLDVPSDLHSPVDADLVYIAHPDLIAPLDPLVEMHRASGLRVQVVRVDDIYDEYSGGRLDPAAIRNYLYHAWTDYVGDPLTFVTLVGDTSYDYRDTENRYLGPNWRKFPQAMVPTAYVVSHSTNEYLVASDSYFVSLLPDEQPDSDVPIPQLALTRISAYEPSQIETYVAHATAYPGLPGGLWQTTHVLLADNTVVYNGPPPDGSLNEGINFDIYAENMLRSAAQAGLTNDKVYMTALGMGRTRYSYYTPQKYDVGKRRWATREHVTPTFWEALRQGELIISYIGHGAWHTWTHELAETNRPPLYRDFDEWECPVPPLLIQSSCSVGDFDRTPSIDRNCVSELLLWHPYGCIAVTGSSRTSSGGTQDDYHRALLDAFYHPERRLEIPTFGMAHMQDLLLAGDSFSRQRQTMFGDAASRFRRAEPGLDLDQPTDLGYPFDVKVARGEVLDVSGHLVSQSPDSPPYTGTVQIRAYDRPVMPYTYNETRIYRLVGAASAELESGEFSTQLALPLDMYDDLSGYEIYPYTLELRASLVDTLTGTTITDSPFSGDRVWSMPIVGSVEPPEDNEGPIVSLFFDDGAVASGDYVDGSVKLTAELEDPQGILLIRSDGGVPMASGDIDRPIVLVARAENHSFDIDLTDYYTPVPGDYTRGAVERQLDLPAGDYTLTLYCYDNFGEPGSASAELVVADELALSEVLVVPNPAPGPTAFTFFASTRPDQARVRIYTPVGRLVKTLEATDLVTGFNVIEWDGNDNGGRPLANGVYLYSIEARDGDETTTAFEKFIMLR